MMLNDDIKKELNQASDMDAFLIIISKHYDLKNAKLNIVNRPLILSGLGKVLQLVNAKRKS